MTALLNISWCEIISTEVIHIMLCSEIDSCFLIDFIDSCFQNFELFSEFYSYFQNFPTVLKNFTAVFRTLQLFSEFYSCFQNFRTVFRILQLSSEF